MKNALPSVNEVLDKIFLYFGAVEGYILSSLAFTPPDSTEQADIKPVSPGLVYPVATDVL